MVQELWHSAALAGPHLIFIVSRYVLFSYYYDLVNIHFVQHKIDLQMPIRRLYSNFLIEKHILVERFAEGNKHLLCLY